MAFKIEDLMTRIVPLAACPDDTMDKCRHDTEPPCPDDTKHICPDDTKNICPDDTQDCPDDTMTGQPRKGHVSEGGSSGLNLLQHQLRERLVQGPVEAGP